MSRLSTVSVALCTYNGERFLQEQFASILRQTRLPDEVVIRDDRSSDRTPQILEAFRREAPFKVDYRINEQTLGARKNFENAILACNGQYIALSDQDDIWYRDRLQQSERELVDHPEAGLLFSDGDIIDEHSRPTGESLWKNFRLHPRSLEDLQSGNYLPFAQRTFVTGATVMVRADLAKICFPIGKLWWHDGWLAMLISTLAAIRPIDTPLISYRSHASQQVGLGAVTTRHGKTLQERARQQAASLRQLRDSVIEVCDAASHLPLRTNQRILNIYRHYADFITLRLSLPENRLARLPVMLEAVEDYRSSGAGTLTMIRDLVLPANGPDQPPLTSPQQ